MTDEIGHELGSERTLTPDHAVRAVARVVVEDVFLRRAVHDLERVRCDELAQGLRLDEVLADDDQRDGGARATHLTRDLIHEVDHGLAVHDQLEDPPTFLLLGSNTRTIAGRNH